MTLTVEAQQDSRYGALLELSERIAEALDPSDIAAIALEIIIKVTGLDEGTIHLLDRRRNGLVPLARRGPLSADLEAINQHLPLDDDRVASVVVRDSVVWVCDDIESRSDVPIVTRQIMETVGARALVTIPLRVKRDVVGALALLHRQPRAFSLADLDFVGALAHQTAVALDRARRFSAAERRATRLVTLSEIQQAIAGNLSRPALLQTVYRQTERVLDAATFAIHVRHATDEMTCIFSASDGIVDAELGVAADPCAANLRELVRRSGTPQIEDDLLQRPEMLAGLGRPTTARSLLLVPLRSGNELHGIVEIASRRPCAYTAEDAQLLETIAGQAAVALETIRLYDDVARQAAERKAIIENVSEGLIIADATGAIVQVNRAGARLLGVGMVAAIRPEVLDEAAFDLAAVDGRPLELDERPLRRALRGESYADYEVLLTPFGEPPRHLSFSGGPVYGEDGKLELAITIFRDVTAPREVERLKDEFVSLVSHELKGPLTALSGYAQMLGRHLSRGLTPAAQDDLGQMRAAIGRLRSLIDDLTDMTRLETGRLRLTFTQVEPVALVHRAVQLVRAARPDHPIHLTAPQTAAPLALDPLRIEQVLTNLLTNACKYSPAGAPVVVTLADLGDELEVSVRDRGVGISADDVPHVFDRFYRASNTGATDGSGLGLYVTKMLVEAHGGRIWVESEPGRGSTFTFTVPTRASEDDSALTA